MGEMRLAAQSSLCSGCRVCQLACGLANYGEVNPKRSLLAIVGRFPEPGVFEIRHCTQCGICAQVCPAGAIIEEDGVYRVDAGLCTGCLLCVRECPEGVMVVHKGEEVPSKCTLCGECVEYCPRGAIYDADAGGPGR